MGFLFSSKKEKLIAVFDIGSGSVGGSLVRIPTDQKELPTIINSTRVEIVERDDVKFDRFLKDMILALGFASRNIYNSKMGAPDEIVCVLASPWYVSETRLIKISKEVPFTFSPKVIDEILNKEIASLNDVYKSKYNDTDSLPEIIEHPIVGISLNGYKVNNPLGKKTRSIEMNMVISISPKVCLDKIRETLSNNFHHTKVSFSSFMTSSFVSIRDRYVSSDSYLIMDIGGEITDIGIVSKGVLKQSLSFPYGRKTLLRDIGKDLGVEPRDSYEIFNLYNKDTLSVKQKEKLLPVLKKAEASWGNLFVECVNSLPKTITLPDTIFLTIDQDVKSWFVGIINNGDYVKKLIPGGIFTLATIDGPEFLNMCNVKNSTCDPFMMIEAISITRKFELYE